MSSCSKASRRVVVGQYQRIANLTGPEAELVREELRALTSAREAASNSEHEAPEPVAERKPQPVSVGKGSHPALPAQKAFDTTLTTASRLDYEGHGAFIRDLRLIDEQGETVNILERWAESTRTNTSSTSTLRPDNVGFGMLINTVSGLGIAGATTAYSRLHRTPFIAAGSTAHVRFDFDCRLVPGAYFVNAGVLGMADGTERFLHRVLDGLAFRVAPLPEQIATGLVDIGCRPHVIISSQKHQTQRAVYRYQRPLRLPGKTKETCQSSIRPPVVARIITDALVLILGLSTLCVVARLSYRRKLQCLPFLSPLSPSS